MQANNQPSPYRAKPFFNQCEKAFFVFISEATGPKYLVMSKVRLWDLIDVKTGMSFAERQSHENRISKKHVDFVVIRKSDMRPVLVFEVDGPTHSEQKQASRDAEVDAWLETAGIKTARVPAKLLYSIKDLAPDNRIK